MGEPSYLIGKKGQGEPACGKTGPQSWRVTITLYYYGLHTPDIPLHVLPLCLACRQEIPDVRLLLDVSDFMAPPEGGERERETDQVGDVAMALELLAGEMAGLGLGRRVPDVLGTAEDGAVER